jgi:antitoxin (DNA-binding transcriptional repressor) of toxin-antitoxin stability system
VTITKNGKAVARLVPCSEPLLLRDSAAEIDRVPKKMSYEAYLDLVETSEER